MLGILETVWYPFDTGKCRIAAPNRKSNQDCSAPIAKPLPASLVTFQLSTTETLYLLYRYFGYRILQNAGSPLFRCSSAAPMPQRSCARLGSHLRSGMLPSCKMRTQASTGYFIVADYLFTTGSTAIRHRLLREREGREVPRPEGFRCKAFPPAAIMKLRVGKTVDRTAMDSIGLAQAIYKGYGC